MKRTATVRVSRRASGVPALPPAPRTSDLAEVRAFWERIVTEHAAHPPVVGEDDEATGG